MAADVCETVSCHPGPPTRASATRSGHPRLLVLAANRPVLHSGGKRVRAFRAAPTSRPGRASETPGENGHGRAPGVLRSPSGPLFYRICTLSGGTAARWENGFLFCAVDADRTLIDRAGNRSRWPLRRLSFAAVSAGRASKPRCKRPGSGSSGCDSTRSCARSVPVTKPARVVAKASEPADSPVVRPLQRKASCGAERMFRFARMRRSADPLSPPSSPA